MDRKTRPREGVYMVVVGELLNALFQRFGYQILHLLSGSPGPSGRDCEHFDGKHRIFGAPQVEVSNCSGNDDRKNKEQSDRPLAHSKRREIDTFLGLPLFLEMRRLNLKFAHWVAALRSSMRTCCPSLRRCAPRATICSPDFTPFETIASSSPN